MVYWSRAPVSRPPTPRPLNSFIRALPALALVASFSACLDVGLPETTQAGFLSVSSHSDGAAGYFAIPEATFYANVNLVVSTPPTDSCFIAPILSTAGSTTTLPTIEAGPVVFTRIGTREDTLLAAVTSGLLTYRPRFGNRIPFTPGDSMDITVPGSPAGFPSVITKARTSESFTHDPVAVPVTVQPISFTWTAAPQPGSNMVLSLRYANAQAAGEVNEQIYCGFVDDGTGTIPSTLVTGWMNSLDGRRSVRATRLRTREMLVGSNRRFSFISTFTLPLPPIPAGF